MSSADPHSPPPMTTSSWSAFLKSIATYRGDLSALTAPPFILAPTSLLEYSKYWGANADLLVAPALMTKSAEHDQDPIELRRLLAVIKWLLATLSSQYASRTQGTKSEKKPLNPFLGELFAAKYEDEQLGETDVILEQVCHHPPISAYAMLNRKNGVVLEGYTGVNLFMSKTALNIRQYGHTVVHYKTLGNESYLVTLPPMHLEGLLTGRPAVELEQKSFVQSSAGYYAVLSYTGRGYFRGQSNSFKCRVFKNYEQSSNNGNALYTIAGQWSGVSYINRNADTPDDRCATFLDMRKQKPHELIVKPIEEQNPLESRRAWEKVAAAIREGEHRKINEEKSKIENQQRQLRKDEAARHEAWKTRWFDCVDYSEKKKQKNVFFRLFKKARLSLKNVPSGTQVDDRTKVDTMKHWLFNEARFDAEKEIKW